MNIRRVLVPVDLSALPDARLDEALEVARAFDADVTVLHAYLRPLPDDPQLVDEDLLVIRDRAARLQLLRDVARASSAHPDVSITAEVRAHGTAVGVADLAQSPDLIVIGASNDQSSFDGACVAEALMLSAGCPVWVVPAACRAERSSRRAPDASPTDCVANLA